MFFYVAFSLVLLCISFTDASDNGTTYTVIVDGNVTCEIKNGVLTVNNVTRGPLTEQEMKELEQYNKDLDDWSKWWITKVIEGIGEEMEKIFGKEGSLWSGFGLWGGGPKDVDEDFEDTSTPAPPKSTTTTPSGEVESKRKGFPKPPSFCKA